MLLEDIEDLTIGPDLRQAVYDLLREHPAHQFDKDAAPVCELFIGGNSLGHAARQCGITLGTALAELIQEFAKLKSLCPFGTDPEPGSPCARIACFYETIRRIPTRDLQRPELDADMGERKATPGRRPRLPGLDQPAPRDQVH